MGSGPRPLHDEVVAASSLALYVGSSFRRLWFGKTQTRTQIRPATTPSSLTEKTTPTAAPSAKTVRTPREVTKTTDQAHPRETHSSPKTTQKSSYSKFCLSSSRGASWI